MAKPDPKTMQELEAAAFRRLIEHLRQHPEIQNIDLMNLAGFCRNCLGNWLEDAAKAEGAVLDRAAAREHVYGMPYEGWKALYQRESNQEQKDAFVKRMAEKHEGDPIRE
jgi:uncharacterized protein